MTYPITKLSTAEMAFPAHVVGRLIPDYNKIDRKDPAIRRLESVAQTLFFQGGNVEGWEPKEVIDKLGALRQINCVLRSFEPKHEHKIAGVAFLLNEWFRPESVLPSTPALREGNGR
jgi:hypothetical protein